MRYPLIIILSLFSLNLHAQTYTLSGTITDGNLREALIGVTIYAGEKGAITDFNGDYSLELPNGTHQVTYSYVGYEDRAETVIINGESLRKDIIMGESSEVLKTVTVTADIAIARRTPVAFSNIPTVRIQEELAARDIPMLLNSTPGVYATETGGGDGDARVTIRGFNQRNVAVMLDGIPVNDMENGWVYWSNWFGLDMVTKTMQVQRGLGASKLAIPSVGGTINILTKGIESRRGGRLRQTVGNNGFLQTNFGYTSGRLENGWGVSAAASYKQGNGWVDGNYTKGYFYYLRIDKEIGNHLFSLSGFGAPQQHGQRSFTSRIQDFDSEFAKEAGVPADIADTGGNNGLRWNQHIASLERWTADSDGDTIRANVESLNTRKNYYHKPQFSFRHSWQPTERTSMSNVAYVSIGDGGGVGVTGITSSALGPNLQDAYDNNSTISIFTGGDKISSGILRSSINNHFWVGGLSTFSHDLSETFKLSGGLDIRYYKGEHSRTVYDLLGGDYFRSQRNARINQGTSQLKEGDRYFYDYNGYVGWVGVFGLLEYTKDKLSAFANLSFAETGYSLNDYMFHEQLDIDNENYYISYADPVTHDGTMYTVDNPNPNDVAAAAAQNLVIDSTSAANQRVDWQWKPSYTFKAGAGYNINKSHRVFMNTGYLSRAPRFSNVIISNYGLDVVNSATGFNSTLGKYYLAENTKNEIIAAVEAGYGFKSQKFSANLNGYFTNWNNKPLDRLPVVLTDPSDPDSERITVNINGISARHMGIELDFAIKPMQGLTIEGLASFGDWIWNSAAETTLPNGEIYAFDAKGVHVGDAAQTQLGAMVRYAPVKGLYFKIRGTYFGRNFANFNPEDLRGANGGRESWQMPSYFLTDFHSGYNFKLNKTRMGVRFNVLNLFNTKYISDAINNDSFLSPNYSDFDAKSASVFFGQGRRFNTSFQISF